MPRRLPRPLRQTSPVWPCCRWTIAVPECEDAFFAEGIHDDILMHLAKISSLKVISRTSVMDYVDTTKNMKTIGEELGVNSILEGAVQRSGDRVRINVQLIDADTDNHLWAETNDRELTAENVFAIQSEIATAIAFAFALQATLSPEEQASVEAKYPGTIDREPADDTRDGPGFKALEEQYRTAGR